MGLVIDLIGVVGELSSVVEDPYSCFWKELLPVAWWFVTLTLGMESAMLTCHEVTWVFPVTTLDGCQSCLRFFVMRITGLDLPDRVCSDKRADCVAMEKKASRAQNRGLCCGGPRMFTG